MVQEQFRIHARTIDHLGQNQIADCPTAISELWKNAYDAYARNVALHIFGGTRPLAVITDDGHGMSRDEFVNRWLAVGTDSKASRRETPPRDRRGLPPRPTQGQKGIGRLSVAHLGPVVLVLTKRENENFVASLIDWRVFENPFILLGDVFIPVETFANPKHFAPLFERMRTSLVENVAPTSGDRQRNKRIKDAWARHDQDCKDRGLQAFSERIFNSTLMFENLADDVLNCWSVWSGRSPCGTALFILDLNRELAIWVDTSVPVKDDEAEEARNLLRDTLVCFTDPYAAQELSDFKYEIEVHREDTSFRPVHWAETLTLEHIRKLEHVVEGVIDTEGTFRGTIRVFGKDLGPVSLPPARIPPRPSSKGYVGPVTILLATYEQDPKNSTLSSEEFARWESHKNRFAGFALYRDGLRILPYGRAQSDLFDIDERRGKHAGRHYWAHRRIFARLALSREDNPNLIDKAGREGLQDNQARRELKLRVIDLLETLARRYFGTEAEGREDAKREANARYEQEVKEAGKRARKELFSSLRKYRPQLDEARSEAERLFSTLQRVLAKDPTKAQQYEEQIDQLKRSARELKPPSAPRSLDLEDQARFRAYRDDWVAYGERLKDISAAWISAVEKARAKDPAYKAQQRRENLNNEVVTHLNEWNSRISDQLTKLAAKIHGHVTHDSQRYPTETSPLLTELSRGKLKLDVVLERLDELQEALLTELQARYQAYTAGLESLHERDGVLEGALRWSADEVELMQAKVRQVYALAQLGVTVEIVGHEFEALDGEIRSNLSRLPADARKTEPFRRVKNAHHSLTQKLRFLTPLKLAGRHLRETIRGEEIADYLVEFFDEQARRDKIHIAATAAFRKMSIEDLRSRIYPVFINLLNNALYWVTQSESQRRVILDRIGDAVIVADNGRGVDPDDAEQIFELFFTRRANGRGVGLYLCRENLAAGGHRIEYAKSRQHKILPGANFVLYLKGIKP